MAQMTEDVYSFQTDGEPEHEEGAHTPYDSDDSSNVEEWLCCGCNTHAINSFKLERDEILEDDLIYFDEDDTPWVHCPTCTRHFHAFSLVRQNGKTGDSGFYNGVVPPEPEIDLLCSETLDDPNPESDFESILDSGDSYHPSSSSSDRDHYLSDPKEKAHPKKRQSTSPESRA
ncbi:hypothetical protein BaRGS_00024261 [Batillaria attramentaria]|uniref:Uncharacterized protein n=1 Tax=Batillaria attramentaria TaxID=370345 RepID=A0ABD0KBX8_9CAEN